MVFGVSDADPVKSEPTDFDAIAVHRAVAALLPGRPIGQSGLVAEIVGDAKPGPERRARTVILPPFARTQHRHEIGSHQLVNGPVRYCRYYPGVAARIVAQDWSGGGSSPR